MHTFFEELENSLSKACINYNKFIIMGDFVGHKAKGRISKRVFQECKTRQNFWETNLSYPPDKHTTSTSTKNPECLGHGELEEFC